MEGLKDKRKPLVGYVVGLDMWEEGEDGHWDAQITSHDPTGANLACENPVKFIEYDAYENACKVIELLGGMAGNPDAKEGCRLIAKRAAKWIECEKRKINY